MTFYLRSIGSNGDQYELSISRSAVEFVIQIDDEDLDELKKEVKKFG